VLLKRGGDLLRLELESAGAAWRSVENDGLLSCPWNDVDDDAGERGGELLPDDLQLSLSMRESKLELAGPVVHSGSDGWMKWQADARRGHPYSLPLEIRLPSLSKNWDANCVSAWGIITTSVVKYEHDSDEFS
jgi:hypothetical protein